MRRILVGLGAGLWLAASAAAQSTTTSLAPTTTVTATSTTAPSTTLTTTTSTSVTTVPCGGGGGGKYDPRACVESSTSKEECRQECCSADFEDLVAECNACEECDELAWSDFLDEWRAAGEFYRTCQVDGGNALKFVEFNVPDSCRAYVAGCKATARRHVRQCADVDRCVGCCGQVLTRWRRNARRALLRNTPEPRRCRKAVRCLRRAERKVRACRNACRRAPTCGESQLRLCLEASAGGRQVLACYAKCAEKCHRPESYRWCIQACQGLDECEAFDECAGIALPTTVTTIGPTTSTIGGVTTSTVGVTTSTVGGATTSTVAVTTSTLAVPSGGLGAWLRPWAAPARGTCLEREERTCVTVTTSSTSTSTSTSSTTTTTLRTSTTIFIGLFMR
ncbi:MAG TPA: hypothetical protein VNO26_01445 [Candidatus Limnocylindria bacterium]|nr:hypothetical protein [Candidatus Limnocylindria bacterium]